MTEITKPLVVKTIAEFRAAIAEALVAAQEKLDAQARAAAAENDTAVEYTDASLGYVPTMGVLHHGHANLMRRAREQNEVVAISVFVNPLQFGPDEDYEKYPRTLEADVELAAHVGVDIVFAPEVEEMYPDGEPLVRISSGELGSRFEDRKSHV